MILDMTMDKMMREALYPPRYMGLGCVNLNLKNGELLKFYHHEWTPCFAMFIHNHQFTFDSQLMLGTMRNMWYDIEERDGETNQFVRRGDCTKDNPWEIIQDNIEAVLTDTWDTHEGETYHMPVDQFHAIDRRNERVITRLHNIVWHRKTADFVHPKDEEIPCAFREGKDAAECWEIIEDFS